VKALVNRAVCDLDGQAQRLTAGRRITAHASGGGRTVPCPRLQQRQGRRAHQGSGGYACKGRDGSGCPANALFGCLLHAWPVNDPQDVLEWMWRRRWARLTAVCTDAVEFDEARNAAIVATGPVVASRPVDVGRVACLAAPRAVHHVGQQVHFTTVAPVKVAVPAVREALAAAVRAGDGRQLHSGTLCRNPYRRIHFRGAGPAWVRPRAGPVLAIAPTLTDFAVAMQKVSQPSPMVLDLGRALDRIEMKVTRHRVPDQRAVWGTRFFGPADHAWVSIEGPDFLTRPRTGSLATALAHCGETGEAAVGAVFTSSLAAQVTIPDPPEIPFAVAITDKFDASVVLQKSLCLEGEPLGLAWSARFRRKARWQGALDGSSLEFIATGRLSSTAALRNE